MKSSQRPIARTKARKWTASAIAGVFLLETMVPAYAAVSQLPALYASPPDVNVMFTLDDSGSMQAEAIPDIPDDQLSYLPSGSGSYTLRRSYPNMWGGSSQFWAAT